MYRSMMSFLRKQRSERGKKINYFKEKNHIYLISEILVLIVISYQFMLTHRSLRGLDCLNVMWWIKWNKQNILTLLVIHLAVGVVCSSSTLSSVVSCKRESVSIMKIFSCREISNIKTLSNEYYIVGKWIYWLQRFFV